MGERESERKKITAQKTREMGKHLRHCKDINYTTEDILRGGPGVEGDYKH